MGNTECEDKQGTTRKGQRKGEKTTRRDDGRRGHPPPPKVTGVSDGKDRARRKTWHGRQGIGGGGSAVEKTETEGKGGIQFNFLRNSLLFEIQPPKGCARG